MAIITDVEDSALALTMSRKWFSKVDKAVSAHQRCLNYCISAFGSGVTSGDDVCYVPSDPRYYLPTEFCDVATLLWDVGALFLFRPDADFAANPFVKERVARLDVFDSSLQYFASPESVVTVFVPFGRIAAPGLPELDHRADKARLKELWETIRKALDTGSLPGDEELKATLDASLAALGAPDEGVFEFCG